jgi:hypothetical protein
MYQIVRGQARAVHGREAKRKIDRELHGVVLASTAHTEKVPESHASWFYDLRRGQLKVYGALLRFIDISIANGTPRDVLKMIPRFLDAYIDEVYEDSQRARVGRAA